jgi:hypothetical protein
MMQNFHANNQREDGQAERGSALSTHAPSCRSIDFPGELFEFRPDVVIPRWQWALSMLMRLSKLAGRAGRIVLLSREDVDRAYGRFTGIEAGPIQKGMLTEDARLRSVLSRTGTGGCFAVAESRWAREQQRGLGIVYRDRHHPDWRWTHGFVETLHPASNWQRFILQPAVAYTTSAKPRHRRLQNAWCGCRPRPLSLT